MKGAIVKSMQLPAFSEETTWRIDHCDRRQMLYASVSRILNISLVGSQNGGVVTVLALCRPIEEMPWPCTVDPCSMCEDPLPHI